MSFLIIDNKTNIPDVSYEQPEVAELLVRNLNNYRNGSFRMEHSWNKTIYNKNRPSEAQLWRINQIENPSRKFTGITRQAASKYLDQHIHGGYKDMRLLEPETDEERYIMSMPM